MAPEPLVALLAESAIACIAAILARRAKVLALVLGMAAFLGPAWLAGPSPLARGLCALVGFVGLLRVVDTVRIREPWSAWRRVVHVASFVDSRTLRRAERELDLRALGRAALFAALFAAGWYVAHSPRLVVRWLAGLVLAYSAVESGYAFTAVAYRLVGFATPPLHVWPIASMSAGELWGERWARPVSRWLRETCFRPLARRGHPVLGLWFGFVVSAIGHAYPAFVALDAKMAASMFAFFFLQGIFVIVETRIAVARWSRPARRAWTATIMIASSPLFVEPALRAIIPA